MASLATKLDKMNHLMTQIDHTMHTGSGAYHDWKRKARKLAEQLPEEYWMNIDNNDQVTDRLTTAEKWMDRGDRVRIIETRKQYRNAF
jgi:hypothetical protein